MARSPDVIAVYHQAVGWGPGALAVFALSWHLRRRLTWPWLAVFLVLFLAAATLSWGHISSLISVHRTSTLTPIGPWCVQSAHVYARFILACIFMMLGAIAWDARTRARTDGLHLAGVSIWLVASAIQFLTYRFFF
jgi:hypothetical protein